MQLAIFLNPQASFKDDKGNIVKPIEDLNDFLGKHEIVKTVEMVIPPYTMPASNLDKKVNIFGPQIVVMVYYKEY